MTRLRSNRRQAAAMAFSSTDTSFAGERAHIVKVFREIVFRMTPAQLRDQGENLLEIYQTIQGDAVVAEAVGTEASKHEMPARLRELAASIEEGTSSSKSSALDKRLNWLVNTLGLTETDECILGVVARVGIFETWGSLAEVVAGRLASDLSPSALAVLTGISSTEIDKRVHRGAPLNRLGLVESNGDGSYSAGELLKTIARASARSGRQLAAQLTPPGRKSQLSWKDFEHLDAERDLAERLVRSGEGVSILLYGPPGTGKTEFAILLARRVGAQAVFAGEADESGGEPYRQERVGHFMLLRAMTRRDPKRIVVLDEADDVLLIPESHNRQSTSKLWLNRIVEESERPTIFILNQQDKLEESLIRRMGLAIEFPMPTRAVRERIARRHARRHRIALGDAAIFRLASLPAAPAVIGNAVQGAARARKTGGGDSQAADAILIGEGLAAAITGHVPPATRLPEAYDPSLALADTDLDALAHKLTNAPNRGWSLLLSGPSGTGKSAYAHHLAKRLEVELIERRGSDLLGMFVGQTEANIAAAFREAARAKGILLIDEADDFLFDRREARHGWERSMVNEMLRQMEALQAPFVATTNLADGFDPATQRRFTMRAAFEALDEDRARRLFRRWFAADVPAGQRLHRQTPGDFAVVARRAELLGEGDPRRLLAWLREESAMRGEGKGMMGFAA